MRVAVINASPTVYNLACDRIRAWHLARGDEVVEDLRLMLDDLGRAYFSIIFTWDIPAMTQRVLDLKAARPGVEVEIGGPAATFMAKHIEARTGIAPHRGLDMRFEFQEPLDRPYQLTFTSRGCPHSCKFCGVKRVEPCFLVYDSFPLAPMVGDNNILATPHSHQLRVVDRYQGYGVVDFNSGFDVRFFRKTHYHLFRRIRLSCWRFAFDTMDVEEDVTRVCRLLASHGLDRHQVTFYCLIGFPGTTPEEALRRIKTVIELGMMVYPMRFWPLNSLKRDYVAPGWTRELLEKVQLYYQTPLFWMGGLPFEEFKLKYRAPSAIRKEQGALL